MKKILTFFICFLATSFISAAPFNVNGINYNVTSGTNVQVAANNCFIGALSLPTTVTDNGITYNVTSIGTSAFESCASLTSVTIPNSVTSIGDYAFDSCTSLISVTIPNSVTSIGDAAFSNCSTLTSITIPNSVTSIGNGVFYFCSALTTVTIPDSVTSIGTYAFYYCSGLTSITIPNSVTSIGISTFDSCTSLTSISIPNSVTSIGNYAFYNCSALTSVKCDIVTPLSINANVFLNVNQSSCTLTVPATSVSAYEAAAVWTDFSPIVGDATLSALENNFKNNVQLYPNPVKNEAVLEIKNSENAQLEVYDMNGKMVLRKFLNNAKNLINTSDLPKGIYLFKTTSGKNSSVTKVLKN